MIKWSSAVRLSGRQFPQREPRRCSPRTWRHATGGKLAITLHPGASLFSATQIKSAVRIGQAQAGEILISLHDGEDPMFGVDVIPFLATSYEDARKLWAASKPAIDKRFAAQGLTPLFAVPWPPQGIYAKKEINHDRRHEGPVAGGSTTPAPSASPRSSAPIRSPSRRPICRRRSRPA